MIDVSPSLSLLILIAVTMAVGVTLILERSLSRIVIGTSLTTYSVNLMIMAAGGRAGGPPIIGQTDLDSMADPLPQAMVLTSIVISMSLTAFILAMSYRSWQLNGDDEVQDDREDRRIAIAAAKDVVAERVTDDAGLSTEESAGAVFDETENIPVHEILALHESESELGGDDEPR